MKKRIITTLFVLLIIVGIQDKASSQNEFQIDYYSNSSAMDMDIFAGVQKTTSGYAIAGMVNGVSAPLIQSVLIATDSTGTVTWAKQIKDGAFLSFKNLYVSDLQTTAAGGYIMTGSFNDTHAMLLAVDGAGNNIFSKTYGNANEFGNRVKELSGGGYIVAGSTQMKSLNADKDSSSIYVFKTDANGNYSWGKTYTLSGSFDSQDAVNDVVEIPSGYVFAGYQSQPNGADTTTNILVFKTDVNGTLQWMKSYGVIGSNEGAFSINTLANGNLIVGGYTDAAGIGASSIAVLELNATNGNLISSHDYSVGLFADQLGSIQQMSNGGIGIIGWTIGLQWQSFLLTLNSSYTPVIAKTYNSFIGGLFTKGQQVPGGFLIGSMIGTTSYQLHMIKTGLNGSSSCNESNISASQYTYTPSVTSITPTVYTVGSESAFTASLTSITPSTNIECIVLPLVADAGFDQTICSGTTTTIGGAPTATYGLAGYTYLWSSTPAGFTSTDANPVVSPTTTTLYIVTVTDANGSTSTSQANVFVVPIPTATALNSGPICIGDALALTGGDNGMTSYNWTGPDGFSSTLQNPSVSNSATIAMAGTYTLTVSNGTCTNTAATTVTVNTLPTADAGPDVTMCQGTPTSLNATGGVTFTWSPISGLSDPNVGNPIANPVTNTTYIVTVANVAGCTASDNLVITVLPAAPVSAGLDTAICLGASAGLLATSTGSGTYSWSPATGLSATNINDPIATPVATTTYVVNLAYANGCSATDDVTVTVNPIPTVTLSITPSGFAYVGQIITITATPIPANINAQYYFYVNNILVQSGTNNIYQTNTLTNGQVVSATVLESGCLSSIDSIMPDIKPIPNAFIPDGTNITNKKFVSGLSLTVINRWGQKLYEGTDGWDGTYNGKLVFAGTYFYIIHLSDLQGGITDLKGSVTVVQN